MLSGKALLDILYTSRLTLEQEKYLSQFDFVSLVISIEDESNFLVYYGTNYLPLYRAIAINARGRFAPGSDLASAIIRELEQGEYVYIESFDLSSRESELISPIHLRG